MNRFKKKENTSKVLFILISKSGNTVETLSNIFGLNIVKKKSKNIIIISEKKNNSLVSLPSKPVSSQSAELFVSGAMAPRGNPTRERQMFARAISNG